MFAGAKRTSGEISVISFNTCVHSATKKSLKTLVTVVFSFIYFAVQNLVFELKQNLEAKPYSEMNA